MRIKAIRYFLGVWCLALVLRAVPAEGAWISFNVYEQFQTDGSVLFTPNMGILLSDAALIAPDGSQFPYGSDLAHGISFAEFSARFFGTWTIRTPSDPTATTTFVFSPFEPKPAPIMTSPVEGSIVPIEFPVRWTNPNTPGVSDWVMAIDGTNDVRVAGIPMPGKASLHVDLHGMGPVSLTIRAGYDFSLSSSIGPLIPGSPPRAEEDVFLSQKLHVLSAPVHVTVVPEPDGLILISFGVLGLSVFSRRRRENRR